MRRLLGVALALWPAATAGAAEIAILKSSDVPAWKPTIEAIRRTAAGHTVNEIDLRGDRAEADRVLGTLKGREVILVALGPLAAQAARAQLPETPLIFAMVQDPAALGLAPAPGLSGVSFTIPIMNQLAAFRMANPRGVRIGIVHSEAVTKLVEQAQKAAGLVRVALMTRPVTSYTEVPQALRSLLSGDEAVDAIWLMPDPVLLGDDARRFVLSETLKAGKPVYTFSATIVSEGALASNGPDLGSVGEQVGELISRMAGGEKAKIEMLIPRAELVINKKIADKLKIDVPAEALKAASKVF